MTPRTVTMIATLAISLNACSDLGAVPDEPASAPPPVVEGKADGASSLAFAPLPDDATFDEPFAALFAPDDPVATTELALIERIRGARAADPGSYAEGANPYRIRYAVYNLRNPEVIEALADAHDAGVDVQVLMDDAQLDPARTWNQADEILIARGFDFIGDARDLTEETRATTDLVGIHHSGLMHLKTRLFDAPGFEAVITGSMNPGDNALLNEETLHLIRDPALIARYRGAYESILRNRRIDNHWDDAAAVNVLFTPAASGPRAGERLLRWVAEEDELVLLMVFSLRDLHAPGASRSLVELLGDKVRAGVPVYLITDRKQSDGVDASGNPLYRNDRTEDELRAAGVHVYEATNRRTEYTAMHHKVGIFGLTHTRVVTDAANWTFSGLGSATRVARNYESQLFIDAEALDGGRTGRRYLSQWLKVLSRYADQSADAGEPAYEEVRQLLMAMPGWPMQPLAFSIEAETRWGESVFIRGDHEALGVWGFGHQGYPLGTDGESYPLWENHEPLALPLGTTFEWKVVIAWPSGAHRWERGENRISAAAPLPLVPSAAQVLSGAFR